jgi:hypothetical protein
VETVEAAPLPPPPASSVIWHLDDVIALAAKLGVPLIAIPHMRASGRGQQRNGSRMRSLLRRLQAKNVRCHGEGHQETCNGRLLDKSRTGLHAALVEARQVQRDNPGAIVVVVSDTRNRILRWEGFDHHNPLVDELTGAQLNALRLLAGGIMLATVLHPDLDTAAVVRHEQSEDVTGKPVGCPPLPPPQEYAPCPLDPMELAWDAHQHGMSNRRIALWVGVRSEGTIRNWLKRYPAACESERRMVERMVRNARRPGEKR